jgi:hypothetical protein
MEDSALNDKRICLCGCGREIISKDHHRSRGNVAKFCIGHRISKKRQNEGRTTICQCGCGEEIPVFTYYGDRKFKHGHNSRNGNRASENNGQWNGGRTINDHGYVEIRRVGHRRAHKPGYYVGEHIMVMERHLNACLCDWTIIHHKNEIKTDNRIENLQMMTAEEHTAYHVKIRIATGRFPDRMGNKWVKRGSVTK